MNQSNVYFLFFSPSVSFMQYIDDTRCLYLQLRRFNVSGFHKSSITALAWSPNGMKLFSGDDRGKIVYSALDLDQVSSYLTETLFPKI